MNIKIHRRPGAQKLRARWEIPKEDLLHMEQEDQENFTQHVAEQLKLEIGEKVVELLQNGDYACGKIKKAQFVGTEGDVLGFQRNAIAMQEEMIFRPFTFCKDCSECIPEEAGGGFCMKMDDFVHITDGCTLGPKKELEEENAETNHDNRL